MNGNNEKLANLLTEIFMMEESEYKDENGPDEIENWDSLATVSMAVSINEEFGYHMRPDEVAGIKCIGDIKKFLAGKGVEL